MTLQAEAYLDQAAQWPAEGQHVLAQYDDGSIVVYQAYGASIASYAIATRMFGRDFSYARMSWIKPNFLWMMYRSGWGTKKGQEIVLALRLRRPFFDRLLSLAVPSSFVPELYPGRAAWEEALASSEVRLQWDPDHDPGGRPLLRRALQLGLRGRMLEEFGKRELLDVIDMTAFVAEQRMRRSSPGFANLATPSERIYIPADPSIARKLMLYGY
jgi:Domain of unknown function (DUF4291)